MKGLAAMAATVVVWAGFALSIRGLGASTLTTVDAALIRFAVPVLVLAPWLPRTVRALRAERPAVVGALCLGAGLPYFLVSALGGRLTSAASVGLVIPGTVPLFVAVLAFLLRGSRISAVQAVALGGILAGVATAVSFSAGAGIAVLVLAGLIWSVYTVALRLTRLDPVGAALVLCVPSAAVSAALVVTGAAGSHLADGTARAGDLLTYLVVQGLGVGVVAALGYSVAIRRLGSRTAASLGALSPVLTAVVAVPLLDEPITASSALSLALVVGGVVAFTRTAPTEGRPRHDADLTTAERGHPVGADRGPRA